MRFAFGGVVAGLCLVSSVVRADVVGYDNLTDQPFGGTAVFAQTEVAQLIRLRPGAGLTLMELAIEFRNPTSNRDDVGQLTMSIYDDVAGAPGNLLVGETFDYRLDRQTAEVFSIDLDEVDAPIRRVWVAWFVRTGSRSGVTYGGEPFVGSTNKRYATRLHGAGAWTDRGVWSSESFHVRVTTVPAPGVLGVAAAGLLGWRRRR